MSEAVITQLAAQMMWLVLLLSLPVVVVASVVGILVSLVQALTQVQDQTIQFLIKLLAVAVTLAATYHWMGDVLINYATQSFNQIGGMRP
ncbi:MULTISPECIES: EscS/YscS/HrcS family type III secretion system export apparatus protein [Burkholderia]|uniref:EscS/YscS/HrcS family type III secretion system export apparatus protein n=1 Tax=Burkholderia humptydooensis TaxID=430531 RepID=A0A7U4P432_9BURK|nr:MULTISPECIES: EscS/YscS/HrcS family type III secretion system export apparatus protein [Burkholderia]AGK46268.1 type III secretion, HrpO family protein [Burkholderia thailandensis MSMB121]ATF36950.1 EscS/YscS/HrcS family type III secretion system export apparatus protein [Burkholderia thailandensis]AJY40879.1 type III secretion, HrpO family protein [Burkholderia sp. 2002721687]ALX42618.1 type III secretion system protein SsaS [Burkholderia humptydooensis]KST74323.1 type III secretion system